MLRASGHRAGALRWKEGLAQEEVCPAADTQLTVHVEGKLWVRDLNCTAFPAMAWTSPGFGLECAWSLRASSLAGHRQGVDASPAVKQV